MSNFILITLLISLMQIIIVQCCTVNSLYNTTCPLGELIAQTTNNQQLMINKENCDILLMKDDFAEKPVVKYPEAEMDKLYTLVMADPDAVNTKPGTYVLHWMIVNINGSDLVRANLTNALTVKEYHPPSPPMNSGIHRYQFTLYKQDKKLFGKVEHNDRANFLLESWLDSTDQCNVQGPIAGLQFRVEALKNSSAAETVTTTTTTTATSTATMSSENGETVIDKVTETTSQH